MDRVIHIFDLLRPKIFGFQMLQMWQMLQMKHNTWTNGASPSVVVDHRACSKAGEIILCDTDVSQDNHVQ